MSQFMDCIKAPNANLAIAKGQYRNVSSIHKFGAVPAMSQNQTGTIWDIDDTSYPWDSFATAGVLTIPVVNASDDGKNITLLGLDADYLEIQETITVSSSASTNSTNSFKRIYRAFVHDGSQANVGDILVQKSGVTVAAIKAGKSQTLMAVYTVPAGKDAYILKGTTTCQSGADATGNMFIRYFGENAFRIGHSFEVSGAGGQYSYEFGVPLKIPAKSDIDVRATVRSNNARVTAAFDIILDEY